MHPVTKTSGVAISALVAATATVLLLPGYTRARTPRGAVTSAAVVVVTPGTAGARPVSTPRPRPGAAGPAARSSPPCRVTGDGTGGARPAGIGRHPCRHHDPAPGQGYRCWPGGPPPPGTGGHNAGTVPAAGAGRGNS
jgi:hypothetical protein